MKATRAKRIAATATGLAAMACTLGVAQSSPAGATGADATACFDYIVWVGIDREEIAGRYAEDACQAGQESGDQEECFHQMVDAITIHNNTGGDPINAEREATNACRLSVED